MRTPLNSTQMSLWWARSLDPHSNTLFCAERIDVPAGIGYEFLRQAITRCQALVPCLNATYGPDDDGQVVCSFPDDLVATNAHALVHLDVVMPPAAHTSWGEQELDDEIQRWISTPPADSDVLRGADVCAHRLWVHPAPHPGGEAGSAAVTWVMRAHHIAVDGYVMFLFIGWVLRTAHALQEGRMAPPSPFSPPGDDPAMPAHHRDHNGYEVGQLSPDTQAALADIRNVWDHTHAGATPPPRITPPRHTTSRHATSRHAASRHAASRHGDNKHPRLVTVRANATIPDTTFRDLHTESEHHGITPLSLLAAVLADYLRSWTLQELPVVLGLPLMNRPLGTRPTAQPHVTVSPVIITACGTEESDLRSIDDAISRARALTGVSVEVLRAELARAYPAAPLCGPNINLRPFPATIPLGKHGTAHITTMAVGPIDDVEILVQANAANGMDIELLSQVDVDDAPALRSQLDQHAERLARAIAMIVHRRKQVGTAASAPESVRHPATQWLTPKDLELLERSCGRRDVPEEAKLTLPQLFDRCRTRHAAASLDHAGDRILFADGVWHSWAEVEGHVLALVECFAAAGLAPGDRVAIQVPRSAALHLAIAACAASGIVWVPVDPALPEQRRAHMAQRTQPALWILDRDTLTGPTPAATSDANNPAALPDGDILWVSSSRWDFHPELAHTDPHAAPATTAAATSAAEQLLARAQMDISADSDAYVLFTSGSTGMPKGVAVGQEAIANRLAWQADMLGLGHSSVLVQKTSCAFDVSVWEFLYATCYGIPTAIAPAQAHTDPAQLTAVFDAAGVTVCHFVPSALRAAIGWWAANPTCRPRTLEVVVTSGEALPRDVVDQVTQLLGVRVANFYGPTEAAIDVTACWAHDTDSEVPIGDAVWRTTALVVDDLWRLTPPGGVGRLLLGGVQLARCYLGDPERTAEAFIPAALETHTTPRTATHVITDNSFATPAQLPEWARGRMYDTGDLARLTPAGLMYCGRRDGQVKLRGQRVELGEITAQLRTTPHVADACTVLATVAGSEHLAAYVVLHPHNGPAHDVAEAIMARAAATLADYMVPTSLAFVDQIPLSVSGKLDAKALPPVTAESLAQARVARSAAPPHVPAANAQDEPAHNGPTSSCAQGSTPPQGTHHCDEVIEKHGSDHCSTTDAVAHDASRAHHDEAFLREVTLASMRRLLSPADPTSPGASVMPTTGMNHIDTSTNFFDAGGTSLAAVAFATELSAQLNTPVSIADVFAHPTAAELAQHLARGGDTWPRAAGEVWTLRPHRGGRPVVCVYPAGGLSWAYAQLVPHIAAERGVFAVQAPGLVGDVAGDGALSTSIADAARRAWDALAADGVVSRMQSTVAHDDPAGGDLAGDEPAGGNAEDPEEGLPVDLVGWSVGGVIAQEMAAHSPNLVRRVVLLDAYPSPVWQDLPAPEPAEILQGVLAMAGVSPAEQHTSLGRGASTEELAVSAAHMLRQTPGVFSSLSEEHIRRIITLIAHHAAIMRDHVTSKIPHDVLMVQAEKNPRPMDPRAWEPFVGAMRIHPLPVDHPGMVSPEAFAVVGAELAEL